MRPVGGRTASLLRFSDESWVSTFHHMIQSEKPEDAHDALQVLIEESDLLLTKPEDVEDLRKFIMDLALNGLLTKQEISDEPAEDFLKRVDRERLERINNKEIQRQKNLPDIESSFNPRPLGNYSNW